MHTLVASFLGRDCPGVVSAVAGLMDEAQCDIAEVSQTILKGEFAAIFIVNAPDSLTDTDLHRHLQLGLAERQVDLSAIVRPAIEGFWAANRSCQSFVITCDGPDSRGLVAALSGVCARHEVNIENFKALVGEGGEGHALIVLEVKVPEHVDITRLRRELQEQGQRLHLRIGVQHRDIFEAMHRVLPI